MQQLRFASKQNSYESASSIMDSSTDVGPMSSLSPIEYSNPMPGADKIDVSITDICKSGTTLNLFFPISLGINRCDYKLPVQFSSISNYHKAIIQNINQMCSSDVIYLYENNSVCLLASI